MTKSNHNQQDRLTDEPVEVEYEEEEQEEQVQKDDDDDDDDDDDETTTLSSARRRRRRQQQDPNVLPTRRSRSMSGGGDSGCCCTGETTTTTTMMSDVDSVVSISTIQTTTTTTSSSSSATYYGELRTEGDAGSGNSSSNSPQQPSPSRSSYGDQLYRRLQDPDVDEMIREKRTPETFTKSKESILRNGSDPSMLLKAELYHRLQQDPNLFEWIQCALGDGIWYYDMEHSHEWYSPEFKELFGYTDDEVPNDPTWWQENIFPEDLTRIMKGFGEHITTGKPFDEVVRYRHKNGSTVWVRCRGKAFFNEAGVPIRMLGAHNDLTALMCVQEELKKKEAVLDMLCTTSLDGYWDWNIVTGVNFMSVRWKTLLGYTDDELVNRIETWWSLLLPEDVPKLQNAIERHQQSDAIEPLNVVLRYRRKDGTIAFMLTQGVAQKDDTTKQWIRMFGTQTDVSYLEEARAAKEASAAKTTFLATMSHEIRTPLNAVLGMAQVLMTTELTEEQLDCVNTLHNSGAHLLSLINDILDFSQIESGIVRMTNEQIDIQTSVRNVVDVLQHSALQKNVQLFYSSEIPSRSIFYGDAERVRQIVFNLVGNAVKFTSHGYVHVSIVPEIRRCCPRSKTTISTATTTNGSHDHHSFQSSCSSSSPANTTDTTVFPDHHDDAGSSTDDNNNNNNEEDDDDSGEMGILITVQDTGCGIADDQINIIFDDFKQANNAIRSMYGGSGLGLSICKKIVAAKGGTIAVTSQQDVGSTFTVWLPGLTVPTPPVVSPTTTTTTTPIITSSAGSLESASDNTGALLSDPSPTVTTSSALLSVSVSSSQVPPPHVKQPEVFLYEALTPNQLGGVTGRIRAAGYSVRTIRTFDDIFSSPHADDDDNNDQKDPESLPDDTGTITTTTRSSSPLQLPIIVIHQQDGNVTEELTTFVKRIMEYNNNNNQHPSRHAQQQQRWGELYVIDVGRRIQNLMNNTATAATRKPSLTVSLSSSTSNAAATGSSTTNTTTSSGTTPPASQKDGRYGYLQVYPTSNEFDEAITSRVNRMMMMMMVRPGPPANASSMGTTTVTMNGVPAGFDHGTTLEVDGGSGSQYQQQQPALDPQQQLLLHHTSPLIPMSTNQYTNSSTIGSNVPLGHYPVPVGELPPQQQQQHHPHHPPSQSQQQQQQQQEQRPLQIMVAEDNLINQKVMKRLLSRCHCEVEIANNGVEAIELAKRGGWDIIFMDLLMPVMGGLESVQNIRTFDTETTIVALTANATTNDRDGCYNVGMNGFLTKPVSLDSLKQILSTKRK